MNRIFRALPRLFPFDFRSDYGRDMEQTLREQHREARRDGSLVSLVRLWLDVARDVLTTAPREHFVILKQDVTRFVPFAARRSLRSRLCSHWPLA